MTSPVAPPGAQGPVRKAVQSYIAGGQVPLLGTVFLGPPRLIRGTDVFDGSTLKGQQSGAAAFLHLQHSQRVRAALGGATSGKKFVDYDVTLVLLFRSAQRVSDDVTADYDRLVDGCIALIESDRTLGTAGLIFEAGEGPFGIQVDADLPRDAGSGMLHWWTSIRFSVRQIATT